MSLYSLPHPAGFRALPSGLLTLDDRSNTFLATGQYSVPVPTTDAEAVALGWPSLLAAPAVDGDLWLCDEAAGNLIGRVRGYQLAPQNAPLQNRDFQGLPYGGSLWGKKAVEFVRDTQSRFACTNAAQLEVGVQDFSLSLLFRAPSVFVSATGVQVFAGKRSAAGQWWQASYQMPGTLLQLTIVDAGGATTHQTALDLYDGGLHLFTASVDRNGNVNFYIDGLATIAIAAGRPGDISSAGAFFLGSIDFAGAYSPSLQYAWAWHIIGVACDRTGHDALWSYLSSSKLGTANTYARTNPLTRPINASRVATAAAGMLPPAYNASLSAVDNAGQLGVVCEEGINFHGIGSNNLMSWFTGIGVTLAAVDGPSGMRDAVRIKQTGGGGDFTHATYNRTAPVGATNVAWALGCWAKTATTGNQIKLQAEFTGDAGGAEAFNLLTAATAATWAGGYFATCTPIRAAHTLAYYEACAVNNGDDVDHAEPYMIQNRATEPLAWRRTALAVGATTTPTLSYSNAGNTRYNPARGRLRVRVAGFARRGERLLGTYAAGNNATFPCFAGDSVWVPHAGGGNTVRKLTATTGATVADYATGGLVPIDCCYDPTQDCVWVANNAAPNANVAKINRLTGAIVGNYAVIGAPGGYWGICYDGTQNCVWAANTSVTNTVTKINAATGAVIGVYAAGGAPIGVLYDLTNNAVWVCNSTGNTVTKYNAATGAVIGAYATGLKPQYAALDSVNGRIWISNNTAGSITVLNAATGALVTAIAGVIDTQLWEIAFDGENMWVACQTAGTVRKYRASDYALLGVFRTAATAPGLCWDGINQCLWVADQALDNVLKIGSKQNILCFGAEAGQGSLWLDYAGDMSYSPLGGTPPQARLRLWDDAGALVSDLDLGALTAAQWERVIEWQASTGKLAVFNGAAVVAQRNPPTPWTPESAVDVTPLYVGSNNGADAMSALVALVQNFDF